MGLAEAVRPESFPNTFPSYQRHLAGSPRQMWVKRQPGARYRRRHDVSIWLWEPRDNNASDLD